MRWLKIIWAVFRIILFVLWALIQIPTLFLIATFRRRFGVRQMRVFMAGAAAIFGIRLRLYGKIDEYRPLLLVSNHISIFEIMAFPALFGAAFFAKSDTRKWPLIGWFIKNFGNCFIDRRPSKAMDALNLIRAQMKTAKNPFAIFPEGTTNNGDYVLPFKSSPFDFIGEIPAKIQPIAIIYRDKFGNKIPPQVLADDYAYFVNAKQTRPPYAAEELSITQLLWRTLMRGGFVFETHVLPTFDPAGLERKQIAAKLHEIVSEKFEEIK